MSSFSILLDCIVIHVTTSQNYVLQPQILTMQESESLCLFNYDTHLASIHDSSQLTEAASTAVTNEVYIGLTDVTQEDTWVWTDDTSWDYGITFAESPWNSGEPNDWDNGVPGEDCAVLISNIPAWNDISCTWEIYSLCNYPTQIQIINDPPNYKRTIPPVNNILGVIDILDDLYIEFDITFHSWPNTWGSIIQFGSNVNERYPGIFLWGSIQITVSYSLITNSNPSHNLDVSLSLETPYHFMLHQTQSHIDATFDGNIIANNDTASHSILMNRNMYLQNGFDAYTATISNLYLKTSNLHSPDGYNYNCDATNRWEYIAGSWIYDDASCTMIQADDSDEVGVVWMGNNDQLSMDWTDYKIEVKFTAYVGNHVGILIRAQTISEFNDQGSQYWFGMHVNSQHVVMGKFKDDSFSWLQDIYVSSMAYNTEYTMRIEAIGNTFVVYWDNKYAFTYLDSDFTFGSVGLRTWYAKALYSSIRITFPSDNHLLTVNPTLAPSNMPTTLSPVTADPTTSVPTTLSPVTSSPVTATPITSSPVTSSPVTSRPITAVPITNAPVTASPVTQNPITLAPSAQTNLITVVTENTNEEAAVETTSGSTSAVSPTVKDDALITNDNNMEKMIIYAVIIGVSVITLINCCIFIVCVYHRKKNKNKEDMDMNRGRVQSASVADGIDLTNVCTTTTAQPVDIPPISERITNEAHDGYLDLNTPKYGAQVVPPSILNIRDLNLSSNDLINQPLPDDENNNDMYTDITTAGEMNETTKGNVVNQQDSLKNDDYDDNNDNIYQKGIHPTTQGDDFI